MSTRRTLLTAILTTAISLPAFGQDATPAPAETKPTEATPAEATPAAPVVTVEGSQPAAAPVSRDKDTLSVDFPDEEIKTILRNVADLFELNLVVPETLQGKTSIKLRDVTWRQIFQVVLSPVGYTYVEEGNIIKIVSNESLQQEPGTTEVFILNNAKAADIKPTIDGLIDAASGGKIVIDARSNALVITERPSRMGRIRTIIDQLDKATDQVMIESKFIEVSDRDIRNIGINWASLDHMQFGVSGISQQWDKNRAQDRSTGMDSTTGTTNNTTNGTSHNTTNNSGTTGSTSTGTTSSTSAGGAVTYVTAPTTVDPSNGAFATSTINLADGSVTGLPTSVPATTSVAGFKPASISGTTVTPASFTATNTYTGSSSNGTSGSTSNGTSSSTSITDAVTNAVDNTISNAINNLASLTNTASQSRVATAVFSASDFNIVISALKTQNNTKIVSNPTIVTLNNTEATLNIGEEFPVPSYTYNSERGTFEVSGFNYKPIGVILKVTPQVNGRGVIKMTLEPEVSQRNGETSFGGAGGASIPIIATRKVKTQVSLQDGYTMGIGGLITTNQSHGGTKVPVLGDIPLLGRLFSSRSVNDVSSNLLIFITAKTVSADGASPEEVFDPRAVEAVGMSREDLPPHRAPKGTDLFANPEPAKK